MEDITSETSSPTYTDRLYLANVIKYATFSDGLKEPSRNRYTQFDYTSGGAILVELSPSIHMLLSDDEESWELISSDVWVPCKSLSCEKIYPYSPERGLKIHQALGAIGHLNGDPLDNRRDNLMMPKTKPKKHCHLM